MLLNLRDASKARSTNVTSGGKSGPAIETARPEAYGALDCSGTLGKCELKRRLHATVREKLTRIGVKVVRHAKYVTFQPAEVALRRDLFTASLDRVRRFRVRLNQVVGRDRHSPGKRD